MPLPQEASFLLYQAASKGDFDTVNSLLKQDVPFHTRFNEKGNEDLLGRDAFFIAAKKGHAEIVKLFLQRGANPNLTYLGEKNSALHAASYFGHEAVIKLLIQYGADVNIKNIFNDTPLLVASNDTIVAILLKAGAYYKNQKTFIKNYNLLVDELLKHNILRLSKLEMGCCDGLSKMFIFYEKQDRSSEFNFFIDFICSLNENRIKHLVASYVYSFNKLIAFTQSVQKITYTQTKTRYKSIGCMWDANHFIICPKDELVMHLKACRVMEKNNDNDVRYKFISIPKHLMALKVNCEGALFYDSNNPKGAVLCKNEEELADALLLTIKDQKLATFSIDDVTYGNENRFIDDWLWENAEVLKNNHLFQVYINYYRRGNISRNDLAFCLYLQMATMQDQTTYYKLQQELKLYLDHHPSFISISTSLTKQDLTTEINKNNDEFNLFRLLKRESSFIAIQSLINRGVNINTISITSKATPLLLFSLKNDNFAEALFWIKCGANVNAKDEEGVTPLHSLLLSKSLDTTLRKDLVRLLIENGADVTSRTTKGKTPIHIAVEKGYYDLVYMMMKASKQTSKNTTWLPRLFSQKQSENNLNKRTTKNFTLPSPA